MTGKRWFVMTLTTLYHLTGYAQGGTVPLVTDKTPKTGYVEGRSVMEFIVIFMILIVGLMGLDVAALNWGSDSRDMLPDDHAR